MSVYTKLHGTTTDAFKIGLKNEKITLTGITVSNNTTILLNRDNQKHTIDSTVFFTAYIIGRSLTNTAAYEIKGCYLSGTTTVTGYVVNTYVDSASFTDPTMSFDNSGELTVQCTGITGDTVNWTASIDFVMV
jgi:hypothetical protein